MLQGRVMLNRAVFIGRFAGQMWVITWTLQYN